MKKELKWAMQGFVGTAIIYVLIALPIGCSLFPKLAAPKHNANALSLAQSGYTQDSVLYASFKSGGDLSYDHAADIYDVIENVIQQKISLDSTRKYNTQILSIDHIWLNQLESARADHQRDGNISVNHINVNGALLNQIGNIEVRTETNYK